MLFLISDVTHDLGHVGLADTECAVSRLPLESATQSAALVHPSGGIRLDNPDRVGEGQSRREPQQQVNMVCRSISSQQFASQFPHDAADVSQQIGFEFVVNEGEPTFGAEHDVEDEVREGLGHGLSPRRGAGIGIRCCPTCPRARALGYVITPLRGWTQNPCCDPFIPRLTPWVFWRAFGAGFEISVGVPLSQGSRPGYSGAPAGLVLKSLWAFLYPRAHSLGYILTPLRGWSLQHNDVKRARNTGATACIRSFAGTLFGS